LAGINSLCVEDPGPIQALNAEAPVAALRAAKRAGVARVVHTSSAATIGEAPGTVGNERTPHRGWYLSTYERTKTEGERAAFAAGVGRKPRLLPRPVAPVAATTVEQGFRLARRHPPVCREMVRTLLHGHRYDGSRAERELGLSYTDPRETLRRTVEWARSEGLLRAAEV